MENNTEEGVWDDLADSWATVVGRQNLEWFFKPYGQNSKECWEKTMALERSFSQMYTGSVNGFGHGEFVVRLYARKKDKSPGLFPLHNTPDV